MHGKTMTFDLPSRGIFFKKSVIAAFEHPDIRQTSDVIVAMLADENKRSFISFFCSSTRSRTFLNGVSRGWLKMSYNLHWAGLVFLGKSVMSSYH